MAEVNWFYIENGNKVGPVPHPEICAMFSGGKLGLQTMVWCAQFKDWTEAAGISGFRELARLAPPPPAPPPPFASVVAPPPGGMPTTPPPLPSAPPPLPRVASASAQEFTNPQPSPMPFASPVASAQPVFIAGLGGFAGDKSAPVAPASSIGNPSFLASPGPPRMSPAFTGAPLHHPTTADEVQSQVRPWVRFWARVIDMWLLGLVLTIVLAFVGFDLVPRFVLNTLSLLLMTIVEAVLFATCGTTVGKSILNVSVTNGDGSRLSFGDAFGRAFAVFLKGLGLGIFIVPLITQIMAYVRLTGRGITSWDEDGGYRVAHGPVGAGRAVAAAMALMLTFGLTVMVVLGAAVNEANAAQAAAAYGDDDGIGFVSVED